MKKLFFSFTDFLLPRFCYGCENKLELCERVVCESCRNSLLIPSDETLMDEYHKKFAEDNNITFFTSAYIFEKDGIFQKIIHSLKYENKSSLGTYLGKAVYELKKDILSEWEIELLIPVPLFHLKKAERGYNQSYYIASSLAKHLNVKMSDKVLKRIRFTSTQTQLNTSERKLNVSNVFKCRKTKDIKQKNILLIDDVITTGSTISECARVLKENGAANVYAASAAIANPLHSFGSA